MYDRTYLDGNKLEQIINGSISQRHIYGLDKEINAKLYIYALAVGHAANQSAKSEHRVGYAQNSSMDNNYPEGFSFINSVYVMDALAKGNEIDLEDNKAAYDLAENVVNAGLAIIDKEASENDDDEALIFMKLRELDMKYNELFQE